MWHDQQSGVGGVPGTPGRTLRGAGLWLRAHWAAATLGAVVIAVGLALAPLDAVQHRDVVHHVAVTPAALRQLRLWTFVVSPVVQSDPGIGWRFVVQVVAVVVGVALLEACIGGARTLLVFFGSQLVVEPVRLISLALLQRLGSQQAASLLHLGDSGSSAAVSAVFATFVIMLPPRERWIGLGLLASWIVGSALLFPMDVAIDHAAGTLFGAVIGAALQRRAGRSWNMHDPRSV